MSSIQKGDVVQLKSGGPMMTVTEVGNYSGTYSLGPKEGSTPFPRTVATRTRCVTLGDRPIHGSGNGQQRVAIRCCRGEWELPGNT